MSRSEFAIIESYFADMGPGRHDTLLTIGDDCALLKPAADKAIAVSMDTLVAGVHFFEDVSPAKLGHKALAVNLSDLAAMGATPAWFTLALTLPELNEPWLDDFAAGLSALAREHQIQLVGGDTTQGPLSITIQVHGLVDPGKAFRRSAAKPGDWIFVSGTLGDAGIALQNKLGNLPALNLTAQDWQFLNNRLECPTPRNDLASKLLGPVKSAIDISDGLLADLQHLLDASRVGAEIDLSALPLSSALQKLPGNTAYQQALTAGDDYELCFTAPTEHAPQLAEEFAGEITCIGKINDSGKLTLRGLDNELGLSINRAGYDHFS